MKKGIAGLIIGFILAPYILFGAVQSGYFNTLTSSAGKVFTYSNTLTLAGTDGSTLNVGTGGTLGTAAYTAASAYATSSQGKNLLGNSEFKIWSNGSMENVGSQLVASWANVDYDTFTSSGADITSAVYTTAGTQNADTASIVLTSGKTYKIVATETHTSGDHLVLSGTGGVPTTTLAAGANTIIFEATAAATVLTVTNTAAANNSCTFTLYEVTPGCVDANYLALDGWIKDGSDEMKLYREDGSANVLDGSTYALKAVNSGAGVHYFAFTGGGRDSEAEFMNKWKGRTVTLGFFVTGQSAANKIRPAVVYNGNWITTAAQNTGTGQEWLEFTYTFGTVTSQTRPFGIQLAAGETVYISQPMLVYGSAIGQGNYTPIVGEEILMDANIPLTGYTATTSAVDGIINLEAASSGKIGKGIKAVLVKAYGKDSAAGDGVGFDVQSTSSVEDGISVDTQVNNIRVQQQGWVKADTNGDIYLDHRGSGPSALTLDVKIIGVKF